MTARSLLLPLGLALATLAAVLAATLRRRAGAAAASSVRIMHICNTTAKTSMKRSIGSSATRWKTCLQAFQL